MSENQWILNSKKFLYLCQKFCLNNIKSFGENFMMKKAFVLLPILFYLFSNNSSFAGEITDMEFDYFCFM